MIGIAILTPSKALVPNKGATIDRLVISVIPVQPLKAIDSILVTEFGMVTNVRFEQPLKVYAPILVTELGMFIDVRPDKPSQRYAGMALKLLPKVNETTFVQP